MAVDGYLFPVPSDANRNDGRLGQVASGAISGVLANTFALPTLSATGRLAIAGVLAKTLSAPTLVATGKVAIAGVLAKTFAVPTLASAGALTIRGVLATTFNAPTLASTGKVAIAGTLSRTFTVPALVATGLGAAAGATVGTLSKTLALPSLSATGRLVADDSVYGGVTFPRRKKKSAEESRITWDDRPIPVVFPSAVVRPVDSVISARNTAIDDTMLARRVAKNEMAHLRAVRHEEEAAFMLLLVA